MSSKPTKAKSVTSPIVTEGEEAFNWFEVETLNLFTIDLQQDPALESEKEKENFIDVMVKPFFRHESTDVGFVDIVVGRKADSAAPTKLTASYVFAIKIMKQGLNGETRDAFLRHFAQTIVWHKFRDTFGFIISQAALDFPTLPMSPPGLKLDPTELANAES
jgi:hypothetical protein